MAGVAEGDRQQTSATLCSSKSKRGDNPKHILTIVLDRTKSPSHFNSRVFACTEKHRGRCQTWLKSHTGQVCNARDLHLVHCSTMAGCSAGLGVRSSSVSCIHGFRLPDRIVRAVQGLARWYDKDLHGQVSQ